MVSGEISVYFHGLHEDPIGLVARLIGLGRRCHEGIDEVLGRWQGKFGGFDILSFGSRMAFCGGKVLWEMLAHKFDGETHPSGKVIRLDSLCTSGDDRTARAAMEVLNEVALGGHVTRIESNVARFV